MDDGFARMAPQVTPNAYLEALGLIERMHRLLLDVVKDEFERISLMEINAVQALLLFNVGTHEVTAGELKSRGFYQGSNVSYNLRKLVDLGYMHHERSPLDRRSVRVRLTQKGITARGVLSALFERHALHLNGEQILATSAVEAMNASLRRLERYWTEQIRYIY
ncbi:MarR family winged helix-turn-helix transcriptional regulator [Falsirhodobacter sp. alg1]|uniref:MarR family winged helix-turn-helix transcriptional regulator n=1 Tax=Falsirhodobacter sp. alg1 TaxID=1472418 RepID=UPI0005F01CC9|nr:MarR family transcriptional regulator [Falsirhodobacter sp. alg1]